MSEFNLLEPRPFDLEFDGRMCNVIPMPAKKARTVATKLLMVLSRAMKEAAASNPRSEIMLEMLGSATIMEHVAEADMLQWLSDQFIDHTEVEANPNDPGVFSRLRPLEDMLFAGAGMARWLRWVAFNIEVNCGGFFAELQRQAPLLKTKMKSANGSPTKSVSQSPST